MVWGEDVMHRQREEILIRQRREYARRPAKSNF
jgi:hypothetical protein